MTAACGNEKPAVISKYGQNVAYFHIINYAGWRGAARIYLSWMREKSWFFRRNVGWISGSASTNVAGFGGCAAAYPPYYFGLQPWVAGVSPP